MPTIIIFIVIVISALLYFIIFTSNIPNCYGSDISFESTLEIIEEAAINTKDEVVFYFNNIGYDSLYVVDVTGYCGCIISHWNKNAIAPGSTDSINITIKHREKGNITKYIKVFSTGSDWPIELRINCEVN